MPRPTCDADAGTVCGPRQRAREEGTFRYDLRRQAWYWLDCRTPDRAWTRCPWCDQPLPPGGDVMRRALDAIRQSDGNPHETGEGSE